MRKRVVDSEFKLYIYPDKSDYQVDSEELLYLLKNIELAGRFLSGSRYEAGKKFLSLLTFMGCSPDIELEPQDKKPYCYIEIDSVTEQFVDGSVIVTVCVASLLTVNDCVVFPLGVQA